MLVKNWTEQSDRESGYVWLWRLRWSAVAALLLGALAVELFLKVRMPWGVLAGTLALLATTNWLAHPRRGFVRRHFHRFIAAWLTLDIGLLTAVLYFTGGAHNPFTMLYLLYVAMAVILLPVSRAWWVVALTVGGFAVLFQSPHMLIAQDGRHLCSDMDFHLKGMVLGLGVAGVGVVYFISSLNRALRTKHAELEQIRGQMQEQRALLEMSALAATVAHELATPLGTIAVIGRDLEGFEGGRVSEAQLREDAHLIGESIKRCRRALELIGQVQASPYSSTCEQITAETFFERLSLYLTELELSRVETSAISEATGQLALPLQEMVMMVSILVRNALEASPLEMKIEVNWRPVASEILVEVRDRGNGMNRATLERASEPFFTTKRAGQGIGLGLYLVRLFGQRHGGTFELESKPGAGTTARLRLPQVSVSRKSP